MKRVKAKRDKAPKQPRPSIFQKNGVDFYRSGDTLVINDDRWNAKPEEMANMYPLRYIRFEGYDQHGNGQSYVIDISTGDHGVSAGHGTNYIQNDSDNRYEEEQRIRSVVDQILNDRYSLMYKAGLDHAIRETVETMISEGKLVEPRQAEILEQQAQRLEKELGDRTMDAGNTKGN
jgi:hypothetical protein